MTELLLSLLLCLYPPEWRSRYGCEMRELIEALNETDGRSLAGMVPSLIAGAAAERFRGLRRGDRAGAAAATVATLLVLGAKAIASHGPGAARRRQAGLPSAGLGRPTQLLTTGSPARRGVFAAAARSSVAAGLDRSIP